MSSFIFCHNSSVLPEVVQCQLRGFYSCSGQCHRTPWHQTSCEWLQPPSLSVYLAGDIPEIFQMCLLPSAANGKQSLQNKQEVWSENRAWLTVSVEHSPASTGVLQGNLRKFSHQAPESRKITRAQGSRLRKNPSIEKLTCFMTTEHKRVSKSSRNKIRWS